MAAIVPVSRKGRSVQECQGLGKCNTGIDNAPLPIPTLISNSSVTCEALVVSASLPTGLGRGLVAGGVLASKSTLHFCRFAITIALIKNSKAEYIVRTPHSTHLTTQTRSFGSPLSITACLWCFGHWNSKPAARNLVNLGSISWPLVIPGQRRALSGALRDSRSSQMCEELP